MENITDKIIDIDDEILEDEDIVYIPKDDVTCDSKNIDVRTLIQMWNDGEIKIPTFQRKFVWTTNQASKFIDSVMSNLPFGSFIFYEDNDHFYHVIDGQQRIKSILYFTNNFDINKIDPLDKKYIGFKLTGLSKKSPYYQKTFDGTENCFSDTDKRTLKNRTIPITVITLDNPDDLTSVFYIFERLNKGGTPLTAQEIRNCICSGSFNDFLISLNKNQQWQSFITNEKDKIRQKDVELILRFFALYDYSNVYKKPMKDFLTQYFTKKRNINNDELKCKRILFEKTVDSIYKNVGKKPFHGLNGLNSSFVDSIMIAFANNLDNIPEDIKSRCETLKRSEEFYSYCSKASNDAKSVINRLELAENILFGNNSQDIKIIKLYDMPVSAGTGNWLGDEDIQFDKISVDNKQADFALRISGDSMSPTIDNGNIVLVKASKTIRSGEIGIFTYKNHAYCKRYLKTKAMYLKSENPKYKNIKIENAEEFYINGIVVGVVSK